MKKKRCRCGAKPMHFAPQTVEESKEHAAKYWNVKIIQDKNKKLHFVPAYENKTTQN